MHNYNSSLIDDLRAHGGHATSGNFVGRQVLILTTTGAKTGEKRETPLAYTLDGDRVVIVASKGGAPSHPAWYHNVVANPNVTDRAGWRPLRGDSHGRDGRRAPAPVRRARRGPPGLRRVRDADRARHPGHRPAAQGRQRPPPDARLTRWRVMRPGPAGDPG